MSPIDMLRTKARDWATSVVKLHNTPVPAGKMAVEKARLLSEAKGIKTGIEKAIGNIDEFNVLDDLQLGNIPLIVSAVTITAYIADITKWYYGLNSFQKNLDAYWTLRNGGLSHEQATATIKDAKSTKSPSDSVSGFFTKMAASFTLPLAGAVILLGYLVIKK